MRTRRILLGALLLAGCGGDDGGGDGDDDPGASHACEAGGQGSFEATLTGDIAETVTAQIGAGEFGCSGIGSASGLSLTLAGIAAGGSTISVIITIDGVAENDTGSGLAASMQISRTAGPNNDPPVGLYSGDGCTVDVTASELVLDEVTGRLYEVAASGGCTGALDDAVGAGSLTVTSFSTLTVAVWQ